MVIVFADKSRVILLPILGKKKFNKEYAVP